MAVTNYYTISGKIVVQRTTGQDRIEYLTDALGMAKQDVVYARYYGNRRTQFPDFEFRINIAGSKAYYGTYSPHRFPEDALPLPPVWGPDDSWYAAARTSACGMIPPTIRFEFVLKPPYTGEFRVRPDPEVDLIDGKIYSLSPDEDGIIYVPAGFLDGRFNSWHWNLAGIKDPDGTVVIRDLGGRTDNLGGPVNRVGLEYRSGPDEPVDPSGRSTPYFVIE